jgi:hypothetical protein
MGMLLSLLTGVGPLLGELLKAHEQAQASQDHQAMALIQARMEALKGAYGLAATAAGQIIVLAFAFPVWLYFSKVIIWDNVFGYYTNGTTPAIRGEVAVWMGLIISFIFGHGIVTRIWK